MEGHRDLLVWQKAMRFVPDIDEVTKTFPREELYGLTSQLRRAAVSIPSNIAEGHGRTSKNQYFTISSATREVLYWKLKLNWRLRSISAIWTSQLWLDCPRNLRNWADADRVALVGRTR